MRLAANGKLYEIEEGTTVTAFIRARGLDPRFVIVELNLEPLAREHFDQVLLCEGDRLELVRAVAGG